MFRFANTVWLVFTSLRYTFIKSVLVSDKSTQTLIEMTGLEPMTCDRIASLLYQLSVYISLCIFVSTLSQARRIYVITWPRCDYHIKFDLVISPLSIMISCPVILKLVAAMKQIHSAISFGVAQRLSRVSSKHAAYISLDCKM